MHEKSKLLKLFDPYLGFSNPIEIKPNLLFNLNFHDVKHRDCTTGADGLDAPHLSSEFWFFT